MKIKRLHYFLIFIAVLWLANEKQASCSDWRQKLAKFSDNGDGTFTVLARPDYFYNNNFDFGQYGVSTHIVYGKIGKFNNVPDYTFKATAILMDDGGFMFVDGHHRFAAATILDKPIHVTVENKDAWYSSLSDDSRKNIEKAGGIDDYFKRSNSLTMYDRSTIDPSDLSASNYQITRGKLMYPPVLNKVDEALTRKIRDCTSRGPSMPATMFGAYELAGSVGENIKRFNENFDRSQKAGMPTAVSYPEAAGRTAMQYFWDAGYGTLRFVGDSGVDILHFVQGKSPTEAEVVPYSVFRGWPEYIQSNQAPNYSNPMMNFRTGT